MRQRESTRLGDNYHHKIAKWGWGTTKYTRLYCSVRHPLLMFNYFEPQCEWLHYMYSCCIPWWFYIVNGGYLDREGCVLMYWWLGQRHLGELTAAVFFCDACEVRMTSKRGSNRRREKQQKSQLESGFSLIKDQVKANVSVKQNTEVLIGNV